MNWRAIRLPVVVCGVLVLSACGVIVRSLLPPPEEQAASEQAWARAAWQYFVANEDPRTGLVPGLERGHQASVWEIADAFAATESALRLGLIGAAEFDRRASRLLDFVNRMPLYEGRLPNLAYDTASGAMLSADGRPGEAGWSAVDVGRLLFWLGVIAERHPELRVYAARAILRWDFCALLDCGKGLRSGERNGDAAQSWNEERLGYARYARAGYQAWGFTVPPPPVPDESVRVGDSRFAYPVSRAREAHLGAALLTMPAALAGIESAWDGDEALREQARQLIAVQAQRYADSGILTARTEHPGAPDGRAVLDAVFAAGYAWNTVDAGGVARPEAALVSSRAAFLIWALQPDDYGEPLRKSLRFLYDARRGFYEGRYEISGGSDETISASTNAVVLEALWYRRFGRIGGAGPGGGELLRLSELVPQGLALCLPGAAASCPVP